MAVKYFTHGNNSSTEYEVKVSNELLTLCSSSIEGIMVLRTL